MKKNIILFDGVCNLCNGAVKFIIQQDRKKKFQFASLQSKTGQKYLEQFNLSTKNFDSFILIENEKCYLKSTAALKVCQKLSGFWLFLYVFIIIPPFIRNFLYDIVAKNRYRFFGKNESCLMPTQELKERFLS
ncbi:MAG: thiol-disulfide oxidoreductase DCC family protein [Bacteroidetes bacterium]|nr:MAG: thiol-disulfide oxidoreductase DCC family protein [Bacteroidota bacterium]TAG85823.1 MAG: thiol-disulfide oxidoreductase DCC family protein [Bacteroidota bacterium]